MSMVEFSEEEIKEFTIEVTELLEEAEAALLVIDRGGDFKANFNAIFRAFHSIKGASGMLGMTSLQSHMHTIENHFQSCNVLTTLSKGQITYFLNSIDATRKLIRNEGISFDYTLPLIEDESPKSGGDDKSSEVVSQLKSVPQASTVAGSATSAPLKPFQDPTKDLVFVVDDEPDLVDLISALLNRAGYKTKGFPRAKLALENLIKEKPSAVFTDMSMPEMNGFEFLKEIQKIDSELPVIFVSGYLSKDVLIDAMNNGLYAAIEKPFKDTELFHICINATRRYRVWNLLNKSINMILYSFSDLDEYLKKQGQPEVREMLNKEVKKLLEARRELKEAKLNY